MEIERKFLVKELPSLEGLPSDEIMQGYLSKIPEVRIRKKGERYYRTEKGEGTLAREEIEYEISENEATEALKGRIGRLIVKTRYYIPYGEKTIELDIYKAELEGLSVAEVEFKTVDEAMAFNPPDWFGEDITENIEYRNKVLALK